MSRSLGGRSLTTWAPIEIVPEVISSSPAIERNAVDLPQPDGPTRTMNSPSAMSRLKSSIPLTPPGYTLVTWSRTIWPMGAHLLGTGWGRPSISAAARLLARVAPKVARYARAGGRQTGRPISITVASGRAASSTVTTSWAAGPASVLVPIRWTLPGATHRPRPHGTWPTAMLDGGTISTRTGSAVGAGAP